MKKQFLWQHFAAFCLFLFFPLLVKAQTDGNTINNGVNTTTLIEIPPLLPISASTYICGDSTSTTTVIVRGALENFSSSTSSIKEAGIEFGPADQKVTKKIWIKFPETSTKAAFSMTSPKMEKGKTYQYRSYFTSNSGTTYYGDTLIASNGRLTAIVKNGRIVSVTGRPKPCDWNYENEPYWALKDVGGAENVCGNGFQSPIELYDKYSKLNTTLPAIKTNYTTFSVELLDNGHSLSVSQATDAPGTKARWLDPIVEKELTSELRGAIDTENGITYNGVSYSFQQIHFHTPSEHTINNKPSSMEMHIVHQSNDSEKKILVIALMVNAVSSDTNQLTKILETIYSKWPPLKKPIQHIDYKLNMNEFLKGYDLSDYYTYNKGSLTTPFCTPATFLVLRNSRVMDKTVFEKFKIKFHNNNARKVQLLNGREVQRTK